MSDYVPNSPWETPSSDPESGKTSRPTLIEGLEGAASGPPLPPTSSPSWPISASMSEQARRPRVRRSLSNMRRGLIVAAAAMGSVTGLFVGLGTSSSAGAAQTVSAKSSSGHRGSAGGQGSNARSGPAAGGSSGTVGNVAKSSFTLTTSAGQEVTVNEESATKYEKGRPSISRRAPSQRASIALVLGTVSSTTIKATQVISAKRQAADLKPSTGGNGGPLPAGCSRNLKKQCRSDPRQLCVQGSMRHRSAERQPIRQRKPRWPITLGGCRPCCEAE